MRSKKYQSITKKYKLDQLYDIESALKLLPKINLAEFKKSPSIEFHLTLLKPGTYGKYKTERKFPLVHLKLGQLNQKTENLIQQVQEIINSIGPNKIRKAVLSTTISPGIKIKVQ